MCTLFGGTKTKAWAQQLLLLPVTQRAQRGFNGAVQLKLIQVWERSARAFSARVCGKTIKQTRGVEPCGKIHSDDRSSLKRHSVSIQMYKFKDDDFRGTWTFLYMKSLHHQIIITAS